MPRTGGDADKLGNQYESFWTVECFLEVFVGRKRSITVESFGSESKGVEFHLATPENHLEFYSSKRQTQGARGWSIYELCKQDKKTSRSILGDLFQRVIDNDCHRVFFVSASGANDLREVLERAKNATSFHELSETLSKRLNGDLQNRILRVVNNDPDLALKCLQSLEIVTRGHEDQKRLTERQIEATLYRIDGEPNDNEEIRQAIAEFVLENLGPELTTEIVRNFIASKGLSLRDWKSDVVIHDKVAKVNESFIATAESELINKAQIIRKESQTIVDLIYDSESKGSLVVAPGGWGKSCLVAQAIAILKKNTVPFLALKLDSIQLCSTAKQLGRQLDLPASPTIVLAGIANGAPCVLIVDQLDAMSIVSGRNPKMWEVFRQLRDEVVAYPNMKMILACRDFDLEHDHRLRQLGDQTSGFTKFSIGKLTKDEIFKSIQSAGVERQFDPTNAQVEILGVPIHLLLFLLGNPEKNFSTIAELYDRYWRRKQDDLRQRLGRDAHWNEVIDGLTNRMSEDQSLIAPRIVVANWEHDADNMASENVLVSIDDSRSFKFFHESFFDYAYARRFCSTGKSVVEFLKTDEQHLFRRSQVRQILSFRRENDHANYLKDIGEIFDSPDVRFHIKRMVASQFRLIEKPSKDEWELLKGYFFDGDLARFISGAMRDHEGWFDLLNALNVFSDWLESDEEKLINTAIWFLGQHDIHDTRSDVIAGLLLPYAGKGAEWQQRIIRTLTWGKAYKSEQMKEVFLDLIASGAYDEIESAVIDDDFWSQHYNAEEECPQFIVEITATWLKHALQKFDDGESWKFLDLCKLNKSHTGAQLVLKAATAEPLFFVEQLLPIATFAIEHTKVFKNGRASNRVWPQLSNHADPYDIDDAVLLGLRRSLQWLALNDISRFRELTNSIIDLPHETIAFLLLRSWTANPSEFADVCVDYLLGNPTRLHIGYSSWSGNSKGTGHCAVSRAAIQAISPVCSQDRFEKLEAAVAEYLNKYEKNKPSSRGFYQLLVLRSLDAGRISKKTKLRIEELERKFPKAPDGIVPEEECGMATWVGSPISAETCELMNDDQWISAMKKYDGTSERSLKGGVVELSRILRDFANKDRGRFAVIVDRMPNSVDPMYFSAILDGLCGPNGHANSEEKQANDRKFESTETEIFVRVIQRLHALPNRSCATAILHCIEKLSNRELPEELLDIVKHYALNSVDPEKDLWKESEGNYYGGDPFTYGVNCVRGQSAETVAALIWSDNKRTESLRPALASFATDPVIAVRTCGLNSFMPMLNFDKDEAVRLFIKACENCLEICATPPFDRFVHCSIQSHYKELRPLIQFALDSENEEAVENAARQTILAELSDIDVGNDAKTIRSGSETMRRTAAHVYAFNIQNDVVGNRCADHLGEFFDDESIEVRKHVSTAFARMKGSRLLELEKFIGRYIESTCFENETDRLLRSLEKSNTELPHIICRAAERILEFISEEGRSMAYRGAMTASSISKLVVRQYEQTTDPEIKSHCLELIDRMEQVGYLGIGDELHKLDRSFD